MDARDAKLLNGLALAYMGDSVYELSIREHLLHLGHTKPGELHRLATEYVSAKAQAKLVQAMMDQDFLSGDELNIFKRGRNAKSHSKAKNADHQTYSYSTGFEALIGYLYLTHQTSRLQELISWCIEYVQAVQ